MNAWSLVMLAREVRASWRRLLVFLLCITAGVGGLVAVKSFSFNLQRGLESEARTLMAADLIVRTRTPFTAEERRALEGLRAQGAVIVHSRQMISMARSPASGRVQPMSVRAVGDGYPLYGKVTTGSGRPFRQLLGDGTVLVHNSLLLKMGLKLGDSLVIGAKSFRIADVLLREPDSPVQAFSLGPRVLMTGRGGDATGLFSVKSRILYSAMVKVPPGRKPGEVADALRLQLPKSFAAVETFDRMRPQAARFLDRLTDYLNLIGLTALLLGGIGVAGAVRAFVAQKMDTLAVLKCLGATSGNLLSVYLLLALLIGVAGSLLGVALGFSVQWALPFLLADLLPVEVSLDWPLAAAAEGMAIGTLTTLWFALPPLWAVRKVPPGRVFRRDVDPPPPGRWQWVSALLPPLSMLTLAGVLAVWQAGFTLAAGLFMLGISVAVLSLFLATVGMLRLLRWIPKPAGFELKQGLAGLYRPGNQTVTVVMSLGLGVLLLLAVFLIQQDLLRQVSANSPVDQPNLFFVDIQPGQREDFRQVLAAHGFPNPLLIPIVRGRVVGIKGQNTLPSEEQDDHRRRHLRNPFAFTYRGQLNPGEEVVSGRFRKDPKIPGHQVSLANWYAESAGLDVGDKLTVDIQGVRVTATVTSIRKINWLNRRANFTFVYLPGALERAPAMYVSAIRLDDEETRVALQRDVVDRMPNVTGFDVALIFQIVQGFMDQIGLVLRFMAAFCIAVGLIVLIAAVATTKFQRVREVVLLRTLGATRGAVARVLALEYLLEGTLASVVGALAAGGLSWGLVTYLFQGKWDFSLWVYLITCAVAVLVITATGLASSLDVLMKKPLEVLREE